MTFRESSKNLIKKRPAGILAGWFVLLLALGSRVSSAADFETAQKIYQDKFSNSRQGVHSQDGILFVVVELEPAKNATTRVRNALRTKALQTSFTVLKEHVVKTYFAERQKQRGSPLLANPHLVKLLRQHAPEVVDPQLKFKLKSNQLDNKVRGGKHRYVIALEERELKQQLPRHLPVPETVDIVKSLLILVQKWRDTPEIHVDFHLKTGAMEEALGLSGKLLSAEYPLASFPARPIEDLATFYTNLAEARRLLDGKPSTKKIALALEKAPVLPQALGQLAELCQKEGRHLQATSIHLMNLSGSSNLKDGWAQVLADVRTQAKTSNTKANQQYLELLTSFSTASMPEAYEAKEDTRGLLRDVWHTFGNLNFPDGWSAKEPEAHGQAMQLFAAGGDVDKMIAHLKVAVQKSPRHAPSWNLLGRCLMIQGKHLQALPVLNQAIRLHDDAMPRTNLALCYEALKCPELAQGMALATLLAPKNTDWSREQANRVIGQ